MVDTTNYDVIRGWVRSGHCGELLGKTESAAFPGKQREAYWINSATLVGSLHPDGSRMAVSINTYRAASDAREIVKRFDELVPIHFPGFVLIDGKWGEPPAKPLVKRGAKSVPEVVADADKLVLEEAARVIADTKAYDLMSQSIGTGRISSSQPADSNTPKRKRLLPPSERGAS